MYFHFYMQAFPGKECLCRPLRVFTECAAMVSVLRLVMVAPAVLLLLAVTAKQNGTVIRESCGEEEAVVARLDAGAEVQIRFALADGSGCYNVTATVNGNQTSGWVAGHDLTGLEEFERRRQGGRSLGDTASSPASPAEAPKTAPHIDLRRADPLLSRVGDLLSANHPGEALELLQPFLKGSKPDPAVLMAAGLAAYRQDDLRGALDYWKQSLDQRPDPQLEAAYKQVEQEAAADHSGDKLYGYRFQLRYEGTSVPADTARRMVAVLDEEFTRVSSELGCPAEERIPVIVQSREAYLKTTGASEWSGGQYDGRIHIALVEGTEMGPGTRRLFAHEIVHACLATLGRWPAWLHEGLAQRLSGDTLSTLQRSQVDALIEAHALPKLEGLEKSWSHMDAPHAQAAYALALAAADALYDNYSAYGIPNLLRDPDRLPQVAAELDRKLGL